jgi:phosphohistidine phosphatase
MKKLVLVRHAKSDWGKESLKDIDRHLNERGYDDAYSMSNWYQQHNPMPDLLVSSSATRALSTAFIFARAFGISENAVVINQSIYECDVKTLLKTISGFDNNHKRIMLFGHNPGLTNLVNELNSELHFENVPTSGIVTIGIDIEDWAEMKNMKEQGKLLGYKFPKDFKQP